MKPWKICVLMLIVICIFKANSVAFGEPTYYSSDGKQISKEEYDKQRSEKEELKKLIKIGEQGDVDAQYKLGFMYDNGKRVPQDYKQAFNWYTKAAEQGFADAEYDLALMYDKGYGVPRDDNLALSWYIKAAEQGNVEAQKALSSIELQNKIDNQSDKELPFWGEAEYVEPARQPAQKKQPASIIEIIVNDGVSFNIPRNWVVLSDNKTITLNSIIESALPVSSKVHFQAKLKDDSGKPITTVQIYRWKSELSQADVDEMNKSDVDDYNQAMHRQISSELNKVGGSIKKWYGTKKLNINGLVVLASEYRRTSNIAPFGHFRVQVLRVYFGESSFSFVISYHEESSLQLRTIVDEIIATLRIVHPAYADNCEEFLSYSDQDRALAALEVLTNATATQKLTIAIMIGEACKGNNPDFSRSEANKDAGKLLPYLRLKGSKN